MQTKSHLPTFSRHFLLPKYWGIWLMVGLLRLLHTLPYGFKLRVGRRIGRLFFTLFKSRRRQAERNIQLAMPTLNVKEVRSLAREHFESLGISLFESMIVWWGDHRKNTKNPFEQRLVTYENLHYLEEANASNKGVIILVPHFTTTDIIGLFLSFKTTLNPVYRPHDNPLMDFLIAKGRTLDNMTPVSKMNLRGMIKTLKTGQNLGFLPDQKYGSKGHVNVPFFGHTAPSNPATSKLAKLTNCLVLPTFLKRLDNGHYILSFQKPLKNFPSDSDYEDTLRLHKIYETEILKNPSQYLWAHNRWALKKEKKLTG